MVLKGLKKLQYFILCIIQEVLSEIKIIVLSNFFTRKCKIERSTRSFVHSSNCIAQAI